MKLQKALKRVTKELMTDEDYRRTWASTIAMCYRDCESWYVEATGKKYLNHVDKHIIANEAADYFLLLLCNDPDEEDTTNPETSTGLIDTVSLN